MKPTSILHTTLNTVTPFSMFMAFFLFIVFTLSGFYAGMKYQSLVDQSTEANLTQISQPTITTMPANPYCPQDFKACPDGHHNVGRTGPDCTFAPCPTSTPREKCPCWDGIHNICLPQSACE